MPKSSDYEPTESESESDVISSSGSTSKSTSESKSDVKKENENKSKKSDDTHSSKKRKNMIGIHYNRVEGDYFESLNPEEQTTVIELEKAIHESSSQHLIPFRFKILFSNMENSTKRFLIRRLEAFNEMKPESGEFHKLKNWLDNMSKLPYNKYHTFPISNKDPFDKIIEFMNNTKIILDKTVYGHTDAKQHIMRILGQWISNPQSQGYCIGIHGPAGIGKTSLIKDGLSKALGMPFGFIPLGGATDGSLLEGHAYTYEGSTYGRVAEILMKTECNNPIIFFDELDKVSTTKCGDEIIGILTHLTDISQNERFNDKYFGQINIDLSRSLFVFSYNDASLINPILKDRMITIEVSGYSKAEKVIIAKDYLIPTICKTFQFTSDKVVMSNSIIEKIIELVASEEGVRNLKRGLEAIFSWINLYSYTKEMDISFPYVVNYEFVVKHIAKKRSKDSEMVQRMYL